MEVGLITLVSASDRVFAKKPLKNLGEPKKDEIGEEGFLVGESKEVWSAMKACLLLTALDLFLSIYECPLINQMQANYTNKVYCKKFKKQSINIYPENHSSEIKMRIFLQEGANLELVVNYAINSMSSSSSYKDTGKRLSLFLSLKRIKQKLGFSSQKPKFIIS